MTLLAAKKLNLDMKEVAESTLAWIDHAEDMRKRMLESISRGALVLVQGGADGVAVKNPDASRRLIVSVTKEPDQWWMHASMSRGGVMPTYEDLSWMHKTIFGPDRISYQVFVPEKEHVNIHTACLHLWCPLEKRVTPDFSKGLRTI